ncbi:hypothetical protein KC343_g5185 [Hortaea werneckii]|nr:hypothetical protein KC352_g14621 [Hortaea werneckii]KAI7563299.1 hypothetical protein KC317_g7824 [Hortaea werneckii]KAI7611463.1 hypothetical protein KC346_g8269 [Hortaea werneckii]KAI7629511.1 hypothetical protein KC343_g5185 [Hortaea werneckii]KAI7673418.1 hypothetical protein KC319_g5059 [Hortaea werneckii]
MCFQNFFHYACGHSRIFDTKCDEAEQLGVVYWQKHACPHYNHQTFHAPYLCGGARFYCNQTADAPFLNHAFNIRVESDKIIKNEGKQLEAAYEKVNNFVHHAKELQIPSQEWSNIPAHSQIKETVVKLLPKVQKAKQHYNEATAILNQAQKYYAQLAQQLAQQRANYTANATSPFAPGPNVLSEVPSEVQQPSFGERKDPVEDSTSKDAHNLATEPENPAAIDSNQNQASAQPSPAPTTSHLVILPIVEPENLGAIDSSQKQASAQPSPGPTASHQAVLPTMEPEGPKNRLLTYEEIHEVAVKAARREEAKAKKRVAVEEETSPVKPKKKARPAKKAKPSQEQASEPDAIRRSVRVRNRKIDYAESPGSEDPSPFKSEASGFSIETSEVESSPDKAKQKSTQAKTLATVTEESTAVPRSSFLGAKIGDFQRRGGVAAGAASVQQDTTNFEGLVRSESPSPSPSPSGLGDPPGLRAGRALHGLNRSQIQPSKMLSSANLAPGGPWQPPSMRYRPQPFAPTYASSPIMGQQRLPTEYPVAPNVYSSYSDPHYYQDRPTSFQYQPTQGPTQGSSQGPSLSPYAMPQSLAGGSNVALPQYGSLPVLENRMPPMSFDQPSAQGYKRDSPVLQSRGNDFQAPMPTQYDSMRHSFGTNVPDLTPPNMFADSTFYGEPRKRRRPVANPMLLNNEHMQVPLPAETKFGNDEPEQPYDFGLSTQPTSFGMPQMPEYGTSSTAGTQPFVNMRDLVASPSTQYPDLDTVSLTAPYFTTDVVDSAGLSAEGTAAVEQEGTGVDFVEGNDEFNDTFGDLLNTGAPDWDLTG